MIKEKCNCGSEAKWLYMPSSSMENPFFCDDCVPRGCSCNSRHIDPNAYHPPLENPDLPDGEEGIDWTWVDDEKNEWCYIDEKGRKYPCCEFDYDEEGYEKE
jgi:hypothetical protein